MTVALILLEQPPCEVPHALLMDHRCGVGVQDIQAEMGLLRDKAEKERAHARAALAQAARQADENQRLRQMKPHVVAMLESRCPPLPSRVMHAALASSSPPPPHATSGRCRAPCSMPQAVPRSQALAAVE